MPGRGPGSQGKWILMIKRLINRLIRIASAKQKNRIESEEISIPDQEIESLAPVIDGPDVQSLAINYDELEQIRINLIESARQIKSASNDKSKKVMVRREKKQVTNPKQKRKILGKIFNEKKMVGNYWNSFSKISHFLERILMELTE